MDANGYCKECPNMCTWRNHKNVPYTWEMETYYEYQEMEEIKRIYMDCKGRKLISEQMLENLAQKFSSKKKEIMGYIKELRALIESLEKHSLGSVSYGEYLEILIEGERKEKRKGWKERTKRLEAVKMQSEMLKNISENKDWNPWGNMGYGDVLSKYL